MQTNCYECKYSGQVVYTPQQAGKVDLLVVSEYPSPGDCKAGKPINSVLAPVKSIMMQHAGDLVVGHQFAIGCTPIGKTKKAFQKPAVGDVDRCKPRLIEYARTAKPAVLLLAGTDACRSFGVKGLMKDLRGTVHDIEINGRAAKAVVTYGMERVAKSPGMYEVMKKDVLKALQLCQGGLAEIDLNIEIPGNYNDVIQCLDHAQQIIDQEKLSSGKRTLVAVDTETTSFDSHKPEEKVIAISISVTKDHGLAFLLDHREADYTDEQRRDILDRFQELLDPEKVVTCAANAGFDYKWLAYRYGLKMKFFDYDVLLAEHILEEDKKGEYGLKSLTKDYFPKLGGYESGMDAELDAVKKGLRAEEKKKAEEVLAGLQGWWVSINDHERKAHLVRWVKEGYLPADVIGTLSTVKTVNKGGKRVIAKAYEKNLGKAFRKLPAAEIGVEVPEQRKVTYEDAPVMTMLRYAAMDALITRNLFVEQFRRMKEEGGKVRATGITQSKSLWKGFKDHTMPLSGKIAEMEYIGVCFDRQKALEYQERIDKSLAEHQAILFAEAGREFNPNSARDLEQILCREKGYKVSKKTEKGFTSLDAESLKILHAEHKTRFLESLLVQRRLESTRTTLKDWMTKSAYDGRLHFSLHQNTTATYRLSSSGPNLQNIQHYIKEAGLNMKALFIPDSEAYEFYDLDISNAEMRVLAAYSRDAVLIEAFEQGMDIHSITAAKLFGGEYENIVAHKEDKQSEEYKMRQVGKQINFAVVYGKGAKTLGQDLSADTGRSVTEDQAQEYLDKFFETYPGIKQYIDSTKHFVTLHKFAYTYVGRRRSFPLASHDKYKMFQAYRQAVNFRIQSTAADILNGNLVDLQDRIKLLGGRVVLTVHDSVVFQLPKGTPGIKAMLDEIFLERTQKRFPWLPVAWKYDVAKGPNYGECTEPLT